MATPFTQFDGSDPLTLVNALLAPASGLQLVSGSVLLKASAPTAVHFYDGSLTALGVGPGLLLTSGLQPGVLNTTPSFGQANIGAGGSANGDPLIDAVVNTVFNTVSYDATTLSFNFDVTDPTAVSVSFDLVFGSEEYPEWVDAFVDCAVVIVNGVNYALFNHDPASPLSVISRNLAAGYFQNNAGSILPIEYDGVSRALTIVAPIIAGQTNKITIGIADTGDHILDSGLFLSNLRASNTPGSGVVSTPGTPSTDSSDTVIGSIQDELLDLKGGDDYGYGGGGDDILLGGDGSDHLYGGSGNDVLQGDAGDDWIDGGVGNDTVHFSGRHDEYGLVYDAVAQCHILTDLRVGVPTEGQDTLVAVERVKFSDGSYFLTPNGLAAVNPPPPPVIPNVPGFLMLAGIGASDQVLTAVLNDADGLPLNVNYFWEKSSDGGLSWDEVGLNQSTYLVTLNDQGADLRVRASYTDLLGHTESVLSNVKPILDPNGNLVINLMQISAPQGAWVINPLTTLLKNALDLGVSPNLAMKAVREVLGLSPELNLLKYDPYLLLMSQSPTDAVALRTEAVAMQIAVLTSIADDDKGINLTLKTLEAAQTGRVLDLSNDTDLLWITGLAADSLEFQKIKTKNSALTRRLDNKNIQVSDLEKEWQDFLKLQDGIASTSMADFNIHINQGPQGGAPASVQAAILNTPYLVSSAALMAGLSDPEFNVLTVTQLQADQGGTVSQQADGSFVFTPHPGYLGPVEFTYTVADPQGLSVTLSTLMIVELPPNQLPSGEVLISGLAAQGETLTASHTLVDPDGLGEVTLTWTADGSVIGTGTSFVLTQAEVGKLIRVTASYQDGYGRSESMASAASAAVANVNDLPTGEVSISGVLAQGQTLSAAQTLVDADGIGTLQFTWQANGTSFATGASVVLGQAQVGQNITLLAAYTDGQGTAEQVASPTVGPVDNVNDLPEGTVQITGSLIEGQTLTASHALSDADGLGSITYRWDADGVEIGTGETVVLSASEVRKTITVTAQYTDAFGVAEQMSSAPTSAVSNINRLPTGAIEIQGTAIQGQTLSALDTLSDLDDMGPVTYTWSTQDAVLGTGATFQLTQAEVGKTISVRADYTDGFGRAESMSSSASLPVANANDAPTGEVLIQGTPTQGQTLTAAQTLADADGLGVMQWTWSADGNTVGTGESYVLTQADVGKAITLTASYVDGFGVTEQVSSLASSAVANINDAPTGAVSISGSLAQGQTLSAVHSLADADGLGAITWTWTANGATLGTGETYTLTQAEVGKAIRLSAAYVDGYGASETVSSAISTLVVNVNDAPAGLVSISGTPTQGQTLTASHGLSDADGLGAVTYTWAANGAVVGTGSAYTLKQADVGKTITATASYTDGFGAQESVVSSATAAVANVNDLPTGVVQITGATNEGNTLTAVHSLSDPDGLGAVSYAWFSGGTPVGVGSTYLLAATDVGRTLSVTATYTDALGAIESVSSLPTGVVSGANHQTLTGTAAANLLAGAAGNDTLSGLAGNDTLSGSVGNDVLNGGAGDDLMDGGEGNDLYLINAANEHAVAEIADTGLIGTDELRFTATATGTLNLFAGDTGLERIVIGTGTAGTAVSTGTVALNVNAAALANALTMMGNAGANSLSSGAGNDVLDGGAGNDTLIGGGGNDTLTGGAGVDRFDVTLGTDVITDLGLGGADVLVVSAGAAALATLGAAWTASNATSNSGAPAVLNTAGFAVNLAAVSTGTTGFQITNTALTGASLGGSALADQLLGNAGNDTLTGGAGNDTLSGFAGNDVLNGGAGNDVMDGGEGSDIYLIGSAAEHVVAEISDSGLTGVDELRYTSTATGTLTVHAANSGLERIVLGTGTAAAAVTTGRTAINVNASALAYGVTLVGNTGANSLTAGSGNDLLEAGDGNDTLIGGAGSDTLTGGLGNDVFLLNSLMGRDTLTEFGNGRDVIQISRAVFTSMNAVGAVAAGEFGSGAGLTAATTAAMNLIYDTTSGILRYDADGNGAATSVEIALMGVTTHPALTAASFVVVV